MNVKNNLEKSVIIENNSDKSLNLEEKNLNNESKSEPSHIMVGDYAALMETNGKECESWYYFIRKEGNEDSLKHLQEQLERVKDWYIVDDLSTFDLDLEHFVTAKTAKEMTKLELNSYAFHRKFDGKLEKINFNFTKKDIRDNERMMEKVFDQLGYGQIEDYISDEDLDSEDLTDNDDTSDTNTDNDDTSDTNTDDDDTSESDSEENENKYEKKKLPTSLLKTDIPRIAKIKRRNRYIKS